jgi:hypothetical protein
MMKSASVPTIGRSIQPQPRSTSSSPGVRNGGEVEPVGQTLVISLVLPGHAEAAGPATGQPAGGVGEEGVPGVSAGDAGVIQGPAELLEIGAAFETSPEPFHPGQHPRVVGVGPQEAETFVKLEDRRRAAQAGSPQGAEQLQLPRPPTRAVLGLQAPEAVQE